jgi:hypothetical protein
VIIGHLLLRYWAWAGSNIGAMPGCGLVAVVSAVCFRKPLAAWWHKHFGMKADLAEIRDAAAAAHRIAADLFEHHTGQAHPDAPGKPGGT